MNWTELVATVAELTPEEELRMLDEAHRQRSAAMIPGPDTEHPPVPPGAGVSEPATTAEPMAARPAAAQQQAPGTAAAADPAPDSTATPPAEPVAVMADIVRPAESPSASWSFTTSSPMLGTPGGLPRDDGVPTMDEIREKIEGRWARAEGQAILDAESEAGRQRADDEQSRAKAAEDVLAKIRASINKP